MSLDIFIYRPDKQFHRNVNPDYCYTVKGQNFREWQQDQETARQYKVECIKIKLSQKPDYKVFDYWR